MHAKMQLWIHFNNAVVFTMGGSQDFSDPRGLARSPGLKKFQDPLPLLSLTPFDLLAAIVR